MIEFEESIVAEKGCWIFFNKLTPKEEAVPDPKAKGAKGKGPNTEEEKPTFGRAWIDLSLLNDSGETKVKSRVFLETTEFKKPVPEGDVSNPAPTEENKQSEPPKIFEEAKTYIMIELEISEPIVPTAEKFVVQALPHDLIPPKSVTLAKVKPVKDPDGDFRKQLKLAIESTRVLIIYKFNILSKYYSIFNESIIFKINMLKILFLIFILYKLHINPIYKIKIKSIFGDIEHLQKFCSSSEIYKISWMD